jgi:hypothetical protein
VYGTIGAIGAVVAACCGGGYAYYRTNTNRCMDSSTQRVVSDSYCRDTSNPRFYRTGTGIFGGRSGTTSSNNGGSERGGFGGHDAGSHGG